MKGPRRRHARTAGLAIALLSAFAPAAAQERSEFYVMGHGSTTCAQWLDFRRDDDINGVILDRWALGYLSGRNAETGRYVGHIAEHAGFLAEIELRCEREPSQPFVAAVDATYDFLRQRGR